MLPVGEAAFDQACAPVSGPRLRELRPSAAGALLVGSGGRAFFDRFLAATGGADGARHPLDRFTRGEVEAAVGESLGRGEQGIGHAIFYPFGGSSPPLPFGGSSPPLPFASAPPTLPFQRLGRAAGLGGPGPLGIQIHPTYGPWWAYRALIVWDLPVPDEPPVGDGCAGCDAPCVAACPAGAVTREGIIYDLCRARRLADPACHFACAARSRCVRGPDQRYSARQLAFHMAASMPKP